MYFLFSVIFSFLAHIPGPSVCIFYFSFFFSDFIIFSSSRMFFIFHDFQFFLLYSTPYSGYFKFSTFFSVFPRYIFHALKCILFSVIFSFSLIFQVLQCIFHFSRFLVISLFFSSLKWMFLFSMIFSFLFIIFHVLQWIF